MSFSGTSVNAIFEGLGSFAVRLEKLLKVVRGIRNQQPFYVTDENGEKTSEDVALDDTWNYTDILWNGIQAEKVQQAFEKLNYREQTLLEKRLAICMTCGRVGSWKDRPIFAELAVMFEGSTASGAEQPTAEPWTN